MPSSVSAAFPVTADLAPKTAGQLSFPTKLGLAAASALLLTLAFAPLSQFYLAWIGLVPWMLLVRSAQGAGRAFLWGCLGGAVFFGINLSYVVLDTIPGGIL